MARYSHKNSTCLSSYEYDDKTQTLTVSFVKGGGHSYTVSESVAEGLDRASSKGQYFNAEIRNA